MSKCKVVAETGEEIMYSYKELGLVNTRDILVQSLKTFIRLWNPWRLDQQSEWLLIGEAIFNIFEGAGEGRPHSSFRLQWGSGLESHAQKRSGCGPVGHYDVLHP